MDEYKTIIERLDEHKKSGRIDELEKYCIITSMRDVLKLIASGKDNVVKEANKIMGGEILEYEAKTIYRNGIAEGIERGQKNTARLMAILSSEGRNEDIIKASEDADYLKKLFEEFASQLEEPVKPVA